MYHCAHDANLFVQETYACKIGNDSIHFIQIMHISAYLIKCYLNQKDDLFAELAPRYSLLSSDHTLFKIHLTSEFQTSLVFGQVGTVQFLALW